MATGPIAVLVLTLFRKPVSCFSWHYVTDWWDAVEFVTVAFCVATLLDLARISEPLFTESPCRHRLLPMGQHDEVPCDKFDDGTLSEEAKLSKIERARAVAGVQRPEWPSICDMRSLA